MISSTSFSSRVHPATPDTAPSVSRRRFGKAGMLFPLVLFFLSACAGGEGVSRSPAPEIKVSLAVAPVENLSGTAAPLKSIRESIAGQLRRTGFAVLDDDVLERFLLRNRVRYTSGLDAATAEAFRKETGVDGVVISSLELYSELVPPKVALISRLVTTGETPRIAWTDGVGMAGDDAPGILNLGLVEDPRVMLQKAVEQLASSLAGHFSHEEIRGEKTKTKFRPRVSFRSPVLDQEMRYRVAVIPFFNKSERKNAGDVMVLHFIRELKRSGRFDVIEPGLIREAFLALRLIMREGLSLTDANALFAMLDADLILTGQVFDYQDYQGIYGKPKVDFSVQLIEKRSRQVVWSSVSHNEGDDDVTLFDRGRVNTAHAMASRMVGIIGTMIQER
jgi:TolB-like protein